MSIKQTLINECINYTREPRRMDVMRYTSGVLKTNYIRYTGTRGKIDSRNPLYLLIMSLRRLYELGESEEEFLTKVYYSYATVTKEAGLITESNEGRIDVGHFFNDSSITAITAMRVHPLELDDSGYAINIFSNENVSLLGIAPTISMDTTQNITSIVINVLSVSRILYRRYLAGLAYQTYDDENDKGSLLHFVIWGMITSDLIIPYHDRSMFNRYMQVCQGTSLSTHICSTGFVTPDYVPQLNRMQVQVAAAVDGVDWRSAFSMMPIREDFTVWDLLVLEANVYAPDNNRWVEILNELQWAEFYKIVGGSRSGVDSVVRRYISDLEADSVMRGCMNKEIKNYILERIEFVKTIFSW